ncbi:MAG: hypothetical protein ACQES8_04890 [Thermodesulfobacteriota bacterium]
MLLLLMSFPRRRESSVFANFLDPGFRRNDVWCPAESGIILFKQLQGLLPLWASPSRTWLIPINGRRS